MNTHEGKRFLAQSEPVAVIAARFNELVVSRLVDGAVGMLRQSGISDSHIDVYMVPGALEIPQVAARLADKGHHAGIIALGCVIEGATTHYDVVVNGSASALASVAARSPVPVMNGILTCHTLEQALDRAGGKVGNKGADCAVGLVEMISLLKQV